MKTKIRIVLDSFDPTHYFTANVTEADTGRALLRARVDLAHQVEGQAEYAHQVSFEPLIDSDTMPFETQLLVLNMISQMYEQAIEDQADGGVPCTDATFEIEV